MAENLRFTNCENENEHILLRIKGGLIGDPDTCGVCPNGYQLNIYTGVCEKIDYTNKTGALAIQYENGPDDAAFVTNQTEFYGVSFIGHERYKADIDVVSNYGAGFVVPPTFVSTAPIWVEDGSFQGRMSYAGVQVKDYPTNDSIQTELSFNYCIDNSFGMFNEISVMIQSKNQTSGGGRLFINGFQILRISDTPENEETCRVFQINLPKGKYIFECFFTFDSNIPDREVAFEIYHASASELYQLTTQIELTQKTLFSSNESFNGNNYFIGSTDPMYGNFCPFLGCTAGINPTWQGIILDSEFANKDLYTFTMTNGTNDIVSLQLNSAQIGSGVTSISGILDYFATAFYLATGIELGFLFQYINGNSYKVIHSFYSDQYNGYYPSFEVQKNDGLVTIWEGSFAMGITGIGIHIQILPSDPFEPYSFVFTSSTVPMGTSSDDLIELLENEFNGDGKFVFEHTGTNLFRVSTIDKTAYYNGFIVSNTINSGDGETVYNATVNKTQDGIGHNIAVWRGNMPLLEPSDSYIQVGLQNNGFGPLAYQEYLTPAIPLISYDEVLTYLQNNLVGDGKFKLENLTANQFRVITIDETDNYNGLIFSVFIKSVDLSTDLFSTTQTVLGGDPFQTKIYDGGIIVNGVNGCESPQIVIWEGHVNDFSFDGNVSLILNKNAPVYSEYISSGLNDTDEILQYIEDNFDGDSGTFNFKNLGSGNFRIYSSLETDDYNTVFWVLDFGDTDGESVHGFNGIHTQFGYDASAQSQNELDRYAVDNCGLFNGQCVKVDSELYMPCLTPVYKFEEYPCKCWYFDGYAEDGLILPFGHVIDDFMNCLECNETYKPNEERTKAYALRTKVPVVQTPNAGFKECCYRNVVLASLETNEIYFNDFLGLYNQRANEFESATFTLIKLSDNSEYELNDDTYGTYKDYGDIEKNADLKTFVLQWKKVLMDLDEDFYQIRTTVTKLGSEYMLLSNTYELLKYSTALADQTVRVDCIQDGILKHYGVNFNGSGFSSSIRIPGFFGREDFEYEEENNIYQDDLVRQVRKKLNSEYQFQTNLIPYCISYDLMTFFMLANRVFMNDYNLNNHSYEFRRFGVRYASNKGTRYFSFNRNAIINLSFSEELKNRRVTNC